MPPKKQPASLKKQAEKATPDSSRTEKVCARADSDTSSEELPRTATRPRKRKAAEKASQIAPAATAEEESEKTLVVTPLQIEQSSHLKNWKRWAAVKDSLKLTRLVEGKVPNLLPDRLNILLSSEPVHGRQWQLVSSMLIRNAKLPSTVFSDVSKVDSDYWMVVVENAAEKKQSVPVASRSAMVPVELVAEDDEQLIQRFANELCTLLDHVPLAKVALRPQDATAQLLILTAVHRAKNEHQDFTSLLYKDLVATRKFTGFNVGWEQGKDRYLCNLMVYDSELKPHPANASRIRIKPDEIGDARIIPAVPESLAAIIPEPTYPTLDISLLSAEAQARHSKTVQLCHYVQYVMYGACGDKDTLIQQAYSIVGLFRSSVEGSKAPKVKDMSDVYDGSRLLWLRKLAKEINLKLAPRLRLDITGGQLPEIHIRGHSKGRVSSVIEVIVQDFLSGSNILDAFQAGVLRADSINIMPAWKSFAMYCDHDSEARMAAVHVCQNCNSITFCIDMRLALGSDLRVCLHCEPKTREEVADYKVAPAATWIPRTGKPGFRLRNKLMDQIRSDHPGRAEETLAERRLVIDRYTAKYLNEQTGEWQDAFTWLKANLQAIKAAQALRDSLDYDAYREINSRLDHCWAVRNKYPHRRRGRLEIQMDEHEFARCRGEWQTGTLADPDETVYYSIPMLRTKKPTWTTADHDRFNGLIEQMAERKSGPTALPRGADGAPFPWRPDHKPEDWSWAMVEGHMAYHFQLLDDWCDRMFTTEKCPETLFLELLWQWFDNGGRDPFLRLPMTVYARHAAQWTLGHVHHGQPMRTGWRMGALITSILQRDAARCNVVIEPRIANYMKMDYPESEYPAILQDLLLCKEDNEWFARPQAKKAAKDDNDIGNGDFEEDDADDLPDDFADEDPTLADEDEEEEF